MVGVGVFYLLALGFVAGYGGLVVVTELERFRPGERGRTSPAA